LGHELSKPRIASRNDDYPGAFVVLLDGEFFLGLFSFFQTYTHCLAQGVQRECRTGNETESKRVGRRLQERSRHDEDFQLSTSNKSSDGSRSMRSFLLLCGSV